MKKYNPKQSVELFHLLFLNHLGRKLDKRLYAVKGGCNMRFFFNSIRYSEDMDIDIQTINKDTLSKNVNNILSSTPFKHILKSHGIEMTESSSPKQTATTQRWKILLKVQNSTLPLNTKIEFSRRDKADDGDVVFESIAPSILSQYSLPPIMTAHYSIQRMYEQKIAALACRSITQSRDIFDLSLLINSGVTFKSSDKIILKHITIAKENALKVSFTDFKGQVIAYLEDEYQQQYDDEDVWHQLVENVIQSLDDYQHETN